MNLVGKPQRGRGRVGLLSAMTRPTKTSAMPRVVVHDGRHDHQLRRQLLWNNYGSPALADSRRQDTYGYLYMAGFLTDEFGNATPRSQPMTTATPLYIGSRAFNGNKSYHVTWKKGQNGYFDVLIAPAIVEHFRLWLRFRFSRLQIRLNSGMNSSADIRPGQSAALLRPTFVCARQL
jgi:hypothetical protein